MRNALQAGEWIRKSDDRQLRSTIYGVVGSVLTGCGELQQASEFQRHAYEDALACGDIEAAFRAAAYTMLIDDRLGKKSDSQAWRDKCEELLPQIKSMMAKLVYYQAECSICLKNHDNRGAIKWFDKILNTEGIDQLPFVKFDCYNNLHLAYADLGEYQKAYDVLIESNILRDSLWQQEKAESLRDLTVKYETKETELALAQSESRRSRTLMWLFASLGLLLIGGILFVVYAGRQRRRRMQKEIEFANLRADIGRQLTAQYIEGLESERLRLSKELHDGVCNDLLAIRMNINNQHSPEKTALLIDSCRESVRRISHELMPPEFSYASLDEVVRFLVRKNSDASEGRIDFDYHSSTDTDSWNVVPDAVALEVYRIIQEAIGNAVKHSGADHISVSLSLEHDLLTAVVSDNGRFKNTHGKGIGLESARRRADSISGKIDFDFNNPSGSTVTLKVAI